VKLHDKFLKTANTSFRSPYTFGRNCTFCRCVATISLWRQLYACATNLYRLFPTERRQR